MVALYFRTVPLKFKLDYLFMIVRSNDIETLVLFGLITGGVVLGTLLDALDADYRVSVLKSGSKLRRNSSFQRASSVRSYMKSAASIAPAPP
ncbi:MAG TPA: hypothetical protein VN867_10245, partial [Candidatus Binataceae bacterium]|nr:hypothetical protein [Candidatus Binataceae bacterium]